ncbi:MAG: hypothetical protein CL843_17085 [Crocinitomicaceae bacterium]|nr:hypothetical protein [Crocinitomicaceae bacterium]
MGIKAFLSKPYASILTNKVNKWAGQAVEIQYETREELVREAKETAFGKDHNFNSISDYESFKKAVPVRDYEGLKPYIDRVVKGEENVLWEGLPIYLCKTSGTTSGAKYIPITKASIGHHIDAAKHALLAYIDATKKADFLDGKMIFLQGSPELDNSKAVPLGRLSGIVAHYVPNYLQKNRMPSWETNCIDDWETKIDKIVEETLKEDMRLISGIPSWVQMYFERLLEKTGKANIMEIFPNFSVFVYGGVNYEPYRPIFKKLIGKEIPSIETYPASEGFIAYQNSQKQEGLLLNVNAGIFYEFIPAEEYFNPNPTRLTLEDVEIGVNYALILSSNAGLWGYSIGDTVKFVSKDPYRIVVSGRIKHFTSAFGEHIIGEEVETTIKEVLELFDADVREFHLAPQVNPTEGLPYHEWFIEFGKTPHNMDAFRLKMDGIMQRLNPYYKDLIEGNILQPLLITSIQKDGFKNMMKSRGKLGGQNKIPRLSNDRKIADELMKWKV